MGNPRTLSNRRLVPYTESMQEVSLKTFYLAELPSRQFFHALPVLESG